MWIKTQSGQWVNFDRVNVIEFDSGVIRFYTDTDDIVYQTGVADSTAADAIIRDLTADTEWVRSPSDSDWARLSAIEMAEWSGSAVSLTVRGYVTSFAYGTAANQAAFDNLVTDLLRIT